MKVCTRCQKEKNKDEFGKNKNYKDGLQYECKICSRKRVNQWRSIPENREKIRENDRITHAKLDYRERKKETDKIRNSKSEIKEVRRQRQTRPEYKEYVKRWQNNKYKTDICYKLRKRISSDIREGLKNFNGSKQNFSILEKLPYTIQQLKQHLESQFKSWMSWNNYGKYEEGRLKWHIDHVIPHSSFHYETMDCEEFQKCWALGNLRPLEAVENIKKGNKIIKE